MLFRWQLLGAVCIRQEAVTRVFFPMCRLRSNLHNHVLLAICSKLDGTHSLKFLVCNTSMAIYHCTWWYLDDMQYYWCEPQECIATVEHEHWLAARYSHFDIFSMEYREERGISRDNNDPANRTQPVLYTTRQDDPSYHAWKVQYGPREEIAGVSSNSQSYPLIYYDVTNDIPMRVLQREEEWKNMLDILYDHAQAEQFVMLPISGHALNLNSFHYDAENLAQPRQYRSKRRGFIDVSESVILYR